MARRTIIVGLRLRWWVRPFLALAGACAWGLAPFLSDEQQERIEQTMAERIVRHGLKMEIR